MQIRSFFLNDEPRLRAGWRLLLQTVLQSLFSIGVGFPLALLMVVSPAPSDNLFVTQLASLIVITGSVFITRRWLDQRSITSLGLKINPRAIADLVAGILITFPIIGLIYLTFWAAGWLSFESFAWSEDPLSTVIFETLTTLVVFILVGWSEELLSRGYHLQTIESGLNTIWAVLLSSGIFSILHLNNPNVESIGFVATGIFLAGIFLAFGYLRTRQLWLSIGLHIGWNFFEGVLFGFPVSGLNTYHLTRVNVHGPELWTGGAFGPEAGLVLIPGLILGFTLVYIYTWRRALLHNL